MGVVERIVEVVAPHRRAVAVAVPLACVWAVWASGPGWATPAVVVAAAAGGALAVIDARTHRLPNAIVFPALGAAAVLLFGAAAVTGDWSALGRAGLGALALWAFYLVLHKVNRAGMGLGDVKLSILLGAVAAWFGWPVLLGALYLPFIVGGLFSLVLIVARRATRRSLVAFGPSMLVGTALALSVHRWLG